MRPNRTLPLVLSLAVLAALPLLSGCVEEELEPGYELLEVGPELPEGVSASPDGSIVIGKALAVPEGFTLGEEDWEALAVMNNFECYSIWDCYFKCPWDNFCVCEWNGEQGECVVVPSEEYCKWFKHGCGTGGEGADWKHHVYLDCPLSVQRGSTATCEIRTGDVNLNLLRVDVWWTDLGGPNQYGGMTWGGVATTTAMIKVALSMEMIGESVVLEKTVNVRPRIWTSLPEKNARENPRWVNSIPGGETLGLWGLYAGTEPAGLSAAPGGGPWKGSFYVAGTPSITAAVMYLHNDLKPGGPAYPIPDSVTVCGLSGSSVSLYSLNDTCGYKSRVDDFRGKVVAHEGEHEKSLNKCIGRVNGRLGDIEEIAGNFSKVNGNLFALWTNPLLKAAETAQGPMFASIWEYRPHPGPWKYPVITDWHNGTDGCPHI